MSNLCQFKPFPLATGICDTCGKPEDVHEPRYVDYKDALWLALLKYGGVSNLYYGYDERETLEVRAHLGVATQEEFDRFNRSSFRPWTVQAPANPCPIDWGLTELPKMSTVPHFTDTDCEHEQIQAVVGFLYCQCGDLFAEEICLKEKTLGELIWMVVKEGEVK